MARFHTITFVNVSNGDKFVCFSFSSSSSTSTSSCTSDDDDDDEDDCRSMSTSPRRFLDGNSLLLVPLFCEQRAPFQCKGIDHNKRKKMHAKKEEENKNKT